MKEEKSRIQRDLEHKARIRDMKRAAYENELWLARLTLILDRTFPSKGAK